MSKFGLTEDERSMLQSLVRRAVHTKLRRRPTLAAKFGADADFTSYDASVNRLVTLYHKLGGDPARLPPTERP